jgi:hypothetical protein
MAAVMALIARQGIRRPPPFFASPPATLAARREVRLPRRKRIYSSIVSDVPPLSDRIKPQENVKTWSQDAVISIKTRRTLQQFLPRTDATGFRPHSTH